MTVEESRKLGVAAMQAVRATGSAPRPGDPILATDWGLVSTAEESLRRRLRPSGADSAPVDPVAANPPLLTRLAALERSVAQLIAGQQEVLYLLVSILVYTAGTLLIRRF